MGGAIFVLAVIAIMFLSVFVFDRWISKSKSYRAWEMKEAQREIDELKSRPKPSWADDPIANSIEWTGTAAFGSEPSSNPKGVMVRVRSVSPNRIEFQPISARPIYAWILFFSAAAFVLALINTGSFTFALLFPLSCMGFGALIWLARRLTEEPVTFDKRLGMYWRGKGQPAPSIGAASTERLGRISDIHALQLIGTRRFVGDPRMGADSKNKEFPTYELNLVLKDGTRLSTVCLDDYGGIDHDAKILAAFLQRPLWKPR